MNSSSLARVWVKEGCVQRTAEAGADGIVFEFDGPLWALYGPLWALLFGLRRSLS